MLQATDPGLKSRTRRPAIFSAPRAVYSMFVDIMTFVGECIHPTYCLIEVVLCTVLFAPLLAAV